MSCPASSSSDSSDGAHADGTYITPTITQSDARRQSDAAWTKRLCPSDDAGGSRKRGKAATSSTDIHPDVELTPTQGEVLSKLVAALDVKNTSVVITNPLLKDNPIVYVTEPWQDMCGFTYSEAVNRNPRLTQGEQSDKGVVKLISGALSSQRSCKCMMLNYRSGLPDRPFFNMLSISPIMHQGKLMLYMANLQDYTYHMKKLVSLTPAQFCRSAEVFQQHNRMPASLGKKRLAQPVIFEADADTVLVTRPARHAPAAPLMKRLGWAQLDLEPEHLTYRVMDALQSMDARYELSESEGDDGLVFVVNADISGVACRVLITPDPACEGSYRITCSRLGGDTFAYHEHFRDLRARLGDAVQNAMPLGGRGPASRPLGFGCGAEASASIGGMPLSSSVGSASLGSSSIEEIGTGGAAEASDSGPGRLIS